MLTYVGAYEDRQVAAGDPPRAAARGPGLLHPQPGAARSRRPPPGSRELVPEARVGVAPRADGGAPARAGDARLLGEALRRAGVHDDRGVRPRRLQRQHDDHRARRHARALASCTSCAAGSAAPASAPTPTSSTRAEKPLTETAHERLATLAQHSDLGGGMAIAMKDLEIRGAGNLLGGEQSGPHRRRRLRPLRPAGRRGGRGVPRRWRAGARRGARSSCPSTPTCRTTTSRASGCAWRCTSGWPRSAPTTTSTCCAEELRRPLRRPARAGGLAAAGGAVPGPGPAGGRRRGHDLGQVRPVRAGRAARVARRTAAAAPPGQRRQGARSVRSWCRGRRPAAIGGRPIVGAGPA